MPSARRPGRFTTGPGANGDRATISRSNRKPDQQLGIGYFAALLRPAWKIYIVRCGPRGFGIPRSAEARAMLFRQLFYSFSGTYTYLVASRRGGDALIIDPALSNVDRYIPLVDHLEHR